MNDTDELRPGWRRTDKYHFEHESGRAVVTYYPTERGRCGRHYTVTVDGRHVLAYPHRYIRPFWTLAAALDAAEKRLARG